MTNETVTPEKPTGAQQKGHRLFPEQRRVRFTREQAAGIKIVGKRNGLKDPAVIREAVTRFLESQNLKADPLAPCGSCGVRRGFHSPTCPEAKA